MLRAWIKKNESDALTPRIGRGDSSLLGKAGHIAFLDSYLLTVFLPKTPKLSFASVTRGGDFRTATTPDIPRRL